nr:unnamed protein product [Callosobruchus chinensis]CAH7735228.1 unnamed protein product [Callosobruchus chinensis]
MALPSSFNTLGDLYDDKTTENEVLSRLKQLAQQWLPNGWRDWQVAQGAADEQEQLDQQTLNKLRFGLPTIGIAKAFNPEARTLKEKPYRDMKTQMLQWGFCRGLIIGPPELAARIRGSLLQHELVLQSIAPIRHLFISRKEACDILERENEEEVEHLVRKRQHSPCASTSSKKSRLDEVEERQGRMEGILQEILQKLQSGGAVSADEDADEDEQDNVESDSDSSLPNTQESLGEDWRPPVLVRAKENVPFQFYPLTKEQAPTIPEPLGEINRQGIHCQRLGSSAWNKIRYLDAQKYLQASGVFVPLSINPQLSRRASSSSSAEMLTKMDASLGIITHGLLMQRKHFADGIQHIMETHPEATEDLLKVFSGDDSKFKSFSDVLLQYVCGKRAEIIEARRKLYEFEKGSISQMMRDIPPSEKFLYDENRLSELFKQESMPRASSYYRRTTSWLQRHNEDKRGSTASKSSRPQYKSHKPLQKMGKSRTSQVKKRNKPDSRKTEYIKDRPSNQRKRF